MSSVPTIHPSEPTWVRMFLDSAAPKYHWRHTGVVSLLLLAIGWVDYVAGPQISLELFYLVPIAASVAWLGWRSGCVVAILSTTIRVTGDLAAGSYNHPVTASWNRIMDVALYLIVVWIAHAFVALHRGLEERVRQRTASLAQANLARDKLQKQLLETGRRERSAIGHDLHDGLGQHLTATSMAANLLATRLAGESHPAAENARKVVALLQDAIAKTRQIARGLLLSAVEPGELVNELEELAATVRREHGINCEFSHRGTLVGLGAEASSHLFYIAQEAVRNSVQHARPSRLAIALDVDDQAIALSVTDDGPGLPAPAQRDGMGLRIMQHRSELIDGALSLEPARPQGTRLCCRVSLAGT